MCPSDASCRNLLYGFSSDQPSVHLEVLSQVGNASKAVGLAKAGVKRGASAAGLDQQQETWELKRIARAADSSNGNRLESLTRNLLRAGYGVQIPIDKIAAPYFGRGLCQHPVFSLEKFIVYMIKKGHSKHFLGGYDVNTEESRTVLSQYWRRYQKHDPGHVVFGNRPLRDTVPLVCYGDEGTGKRKHPVYVLSTKALLNCRQNSMFRYILYTVVPHECYRGFQKGWAVKNECLDAVLEHYVLEATRLFEQGWLWLAYMPSPLPLWKCQALNSPKCVGMQLDVLLFLILLLSVCSSQGLFTTLL